MEEEGKGREGKGRYNKNQFEGLIFPTQTSLVYFYHWHHAQSTVNHYTYDSKSSF